MLNKQAKVLSEQQIKAVLKYLEGTRNGLRNQVIGTRYFEHLV